MYVYDTETCGFHGPIVLIQYQIIDPAGNDQNDDNIVLHNVWKSPIQATLDLIEDMLDKGTIGFNLSFDHFHLCQLYTTLLLLKEKVGGNALPIDHINLYAELEPLGRDGPCLKPRHCLDLMLYARKGPYQSTMERRNIVIRRVPTVLARDLQSKLDEVIKLNDIYFARRKERKELNWDIDHVDNVFSNMTLRFKPSAALKVLAQDALGITDTQALKDMGPKVQPLEVGWAPFATALSSADRNWQCRIKKHSDFRKGKAWPGVIEHHISFWSFNSQGRKYAKDDIVYTRNLYYHFRDAVGSTLAISDNDSVLACQVAAARWRGFAINVEGVQKLRTEAYIRSIKAPKAPKRVYEYIEPYLTETERQIIGLEGSTSKATLEKIERMKIPCLECSGTGKADGYSHVFDGLFGDSFDGAGNENEPCPHCNGTGDTEEKHPASAYAKACLDARKAAKEVEVWDKLLQAGRFHASVNVIGTLS